MASVNDIGAVIARRVLIDLRDNHPEITMDLVNRQTIGGIVWRQVAQALHELVWDEPVREAIVASAARHGIVVKSLED